MYINWYSHTSTKSIHILWNNNFHATTTVYIWVETYEFLPENDLFIRARQHPTGTTNLI